MIHRVVDTVQTRDKKTKKKKQNTLWVSQKKALMGAVTNQEKQWRL